MKFSSKILVMTVVAMMVISVALFVNAGAGHQAALWWFLAEDEHVILGKTYKATPEQAKVIEDYLQGPNSKNYPDEKTKAAKAQVEEAIAMINATGAKSLAEVPADVKANAISKVQQAAANVDVTLNVNTSTGAYSAVADGKVLYSGSISTPTVGSAGSVVNNALEGKDQLYNVNCEMDLTFRFDTDYSYFKNGGKVYIDGNELSSSDYTSRSGSTIISVKKEYAKKLGMGDHTIEVAYTNGTRSRASFKVTSSGGSSVAATSAAPAAGQVTVGSAFVYTGSNNVVAVILSVLAVVAVSTAFVKKVYVK